MEDISPALLKKCQTMFMKEHSGSGRILGILKKVNSGTADLNDSAEYSRLIGDILGKVMGENITFDTLPEETLFWNIAQAVVRPMLEQNYNLVNIMATDCQKLVYDRAKIGIKVKSPPINEDRIHGILQNITNTEITAEQLKNHLEVYTKNFTESAHDDFVREQAKTSSAVGLETKVIRMATNCCDWCRRIAGIYDYEDVKDTGNDVWLRHTNCYCRIVFQSEKKTEIVKNYKKKK